MLKKIISFKYFLQDIPLKSLKDLKLFLWMYFTFGFHEKHLKRKNLSEIRKDKLIVHLSNNLPSLYTKKNLIESNYNDKVKILFTVNALNGTGGTEMWLSQILEKLESIGLNTLVFTPIEGKLYQSLLQKEYALTSSITEAYNFAPSVIHLQHYNNPQIKKLINLFDDTTPIFNLSHGVAPTLELPYINEHRRIEYGAVSRLVAAKIAFLVKKNINQIHLTKNFFNQQYIPSNTKVRTGKYAVVSTKSGKKSTNRLSEILKELGHDLSVYGDSPERFITDYRQVIDKYDLFFATGKTALDILGYGKKVILFEDNMLGPAVLSSNLELLSNMNFALASPLIEAENIFNQNISTLIKQKLQSFTNDDEILRADYLLKNNSINAVSNELIQIYNHLTSKK
jgi:hypothetical protein